MPGPFPGTPDNAKLFMNCTMGFHEGMAAEHMCKGGFTYFSKPKICECSCHTLARKLPFGAKFDPPSAERDPLKKTLLEELKEWGRKNDKANPLAPPKKIVREHDMNEDGHRVKGALEQQVLAVCEDYINLGFDGLDVFLSKEDNAILNGESLEEQEDITMLLTTGLISKEIDARYGQENTSQGAIRNVLFRWRDWKFALVREKPIAFLMFTEAGKEHGLDVMKERAR